MMMIRISLALGRLVASAGKLEWNNHVVRMVQEQAYCKGVEFGICLLAGRNHLAFAGRLQLQATVGTN
jgi:hypothetical protein